jgi:hypothetical protein
MTNQNRVLGEQRSFVVPELYLDVRFMCVKLEAWEVDDLLLNGGLQAHVQQVVGMMI